MKLQGKNADIAVPTIRKNLRQPWELSPPAGEGEQGTRWPFPSPTAWLRPCWEAPHISQSAAQGCTGLLQCCSRTALHLLSPESEFANQSNGLEVSERMFVQNRCFQALISLNLQIPFLGIGIPNRLYITHVCAVCIRIISVIGNSTVTRLRENASHSRKALNKPRPFHRSNALQEEEHNFLLRHYHPSG